MNLRERVVASVTDIRDRGQRLAQLNLELLKSELKEKGRRFGAALGLFAGAGVLAFYAVGFALATVAAALALVLPLWLSLLIVTLVIVLLIVVMVLVGRAQIEKAKERAPRTALDEARTTVDLVKEDVRRTKAGVRDRVAHRRAAARAPAWPAATSSGPHSAAPPATQSAAPSETQSAASSGSSAESPSAAPSEKQPAAPSGSSPAAPSAPKAPTPGEAPSDEGVGES
jgi:hypothetical protein